MKADEIRKILKGKKDAYNYELHTTDDFARKKKVTKKYFDIKKILKEMNDAEIVSWYYAKHVENSKRQQRKDRIKEKEVKPSTSEKISTSRERQKHTKSGSEEKRSSSGQKSSRKLADFADLDIEEPDRNLKRSKDETVREWLSYNNFGIADDTLHEEREVDDLPGTQMASISTKINEQKTLKSYNQQSLPSPFPDKIVHKRRKPKVKGHSKKSDTFKELILLLYFLSN